MADLLILAGLIGVPALLLWHFVRLRPTLERKERGFDPLTGALYFGAQAEGRAGLLQDD